jgi:hypothetical protein
LLHKPPLEAQPILILAAQNSDQTTLHRKRRSLAFPTQLPV